MDLSPHVAALLLGLAAALTYGGADFFGGLVARRTGALRTVLHTQTVAVGCLLLALPLAGGVLRADAVLWGLGAGLAAGLALMAYFRGLRVGQMGIVAATAAVVAAVVPVVAGVALGERPSWLALGGIALAVVAVGLVSMVGGPAGPVAFSAGMATTPPASTRKRPAALAPHPHARLPPGLLEGLAAGAGFGGFFVLLSRAQAGGPLWALAAAAVASTVLVGAVMAARRGPFRPETGNWPAIVASGVLGALGSLTFLLASRQGLLSLVSVLAAMSPAATVALARTVLGERLNRLQLAGLGLAVVGVALISGG